MSQQPEKYDAAAIEAQTSIVDLVSRYVELRRQGAEYVGLCVAHQESNPSMTVSPSKNFVHCFSCGFHQGPIGFLMHVENIDFRESCKRLLNGSGTPAPVVMPEPQLKKPPERKTLTPPPDSQPDMRHKRMGDPEAVWTYHTAEGNPLFYVARYTDAETGKKQIRCFTYGTRSDKEPPAWDCKHPAEPRPLYNLHELAENPETQVLIVEGEKAADAAAQQFPGLVITTWPGGSQAYRKADWSPLKGRNVVLCPDNDEPGHKAMQGVAKHLHETIKVNEIKLIDVSDRPEGWDFADELWTPDEAMAWAKPRIRKHDATLDLEAERAARNLENMQNPPEWPEIPVEAYVGDFGYHDTTEHETTQNRPVSAKLVGIYDKQNTGQMPTAASLGVISFRGSERQPKARDWLWRDKIACGVITGLSGDPGLGKSQITASLAAIVTVGGQWPVTRDRAPKGSVIILNCEDDFETTVAPRLIAAGADMDKIHVFQGIKTLSSNGIPSERMFDLSQDINRLVVMMEEIGDVRLVIIDPISAYVGNGKVDSHNNTDVRSVLAPLTKAAEANHATGKQGAAILIVNHLNKDSTKSALHRTQGSVAWTAAPRCIWAVIRDKEDESGRSRLMMCVKNNIGPDTDGFRYEVEGFHLTDSDPLIETSRILWHAEPVAANADQAFQSHTDIEEKTAVSEAAEFLKDILKFGPVTVFEIEASARKAGVLTHNLRRAKAKLKIKSIKQGGISGKWVWDMPSN